MKNLAVHIIIRLAIAVIPIFILINKKLDDTSGNSGMGIDLPMMIAFGMLIIWGIFMIFETGRFFYSKNNKMAVINLFLIVPVLFAFIYIGGM